MKANFHTHSCWCDGRGSPEELVAAAIAKGFAALGFSSHMAFPVDDGTAILPERAAAYAADVRAAALRHRGEISVYCGGEADYIPGATDPSRDRYAALDLDYLIGSIHYVVAPDGGRVCVDDTPERLQSEIAAHFDGRPEDFVRAYFAAEREMVARFDFDLVAHPDLVRKFNRRTPYFDESADWFLKELDQTADAIAASGKLVEVNTGAIARGWLDDAYPSPEFRARLRSRGVRFVLSSDAHSAEGLDAAFDRYAQAESYVDFRSLIEGRRHGGRA